MAKSQANTEQIKMGTNKLKLMYLAKIFHEKTDENHMIDMADIQRELSKYDFAAERKTIYSDIEELRRFGIDIIMVQKGKNFYYYQGERFFELPELKLMVDSVQSAKFITEKKSKALIKKISSLASQNDAKSLQRQVYFNGRVKTMK